MNFLDADIIRITERVTTLDGVIYHWKEKSRKLCKVQKRKSDPEEKGKNAIGVPTKAEGRRSETSTAKTNTHTYSQTGLANKAKAPAFKGTSKLYQLLANSVQGKRTWNQNEEEESQQHMKFVEWKTHSVQRNIWIGMVDFIKTSNYHRPPNVHVTKISPNDTQATSTHSCRCGYSWWIQWVK